MRIATERVVIIDYKLPKELKTLTFLQYDTNFIKFILEDNGEVADLSNITNIIVNFRRPDKKVFTQTLTAVGNEITYRLTESEMFISGDCELVLQLYDDNERLTVARIKVVLSENIENGEVPTVEEVRLVQQLIDSVNARISELGEFENQLTALQNGLENKRDNTEKVKYSDLADEVQQLIGVTLDTDLTTKGFEALLSRFPSGKVSIKGDLSKTYTIDRELVIQDKVDILFENISFTGYIFRSISLKDCKNITFKNCKFYNMQRAINLYNTENIWIDNCTFDYCGYCILGMDGFSQKSTRAIHNNIYRARADFVEMNSNQVLSSDVLVSGNIFHGSSYDVVHPTHLYREQRFVGITAVENVIITNNIVRGTFASAIHVEVAEGQCIVANNTFEHCVIMRKTAAGNRLGGVIEISGNSKDMIITGNYFIKDENYIDGDGHGDTSCFLWFNYHESTRPLIISNNIFDGRGLSSWTFGSTKQSVFTSHKGGIVFEGNKLINCSGFDISDSTNLSIIGNQFDGPIFSNLNTPTNINISNNTIKVKDHVQFSMKFREETPSGAGTLNVKNMIITGNFLNKPIEMRYPKNVVISNNMMPISTTQTTGYNVVDDILYLYPNTITTESCNIKTSSNLVVLDGGDEWKWVNPIPLEPTPFPEEPPLHG